MNLIRDIEADAIELQAQASTREREYRTLDFVTLTTREVEAESHVVQVLSPVDVDTRTVHHALKRLLDLAVSSALLIILAIPALLTALAIKIDSRGPVFIVQTRTGRYGRPFRMVKFRTMCVNADQMKVELQELNEAEGPIFKLRNDPRMTRVGRFLRKTSIDELPQLWNVLKGDMSLVGPRPPLPTEVSAYSEYHLGRLAAKPGMTGLWQVSGRSLLGFTEMVDLDLAYIRGWHLGRDIVILLRTLPAVVSGRGAF